jgi:hypothetical protein
MILVTQTVMRMLAFGDVVGGAPNPSSTAGAGRMMES